MVAEPPTLLEPAAAMPVPPQVGRRVGDDDEVADTGFDRAVAPGAQVRLDRLIRLDGTHDLIIEAGEIWWEPLRCGAWERGHGAMVGPRSSVRTIVRLSPSSLLIMSRFLTITDAGPIRTVTMSNPGRKNAVPPQAWPDLAEAFVRFESSEQRVLVLAGADGDFCAGADMNKPAEGEPSVAVTAQRMRVINSAVAALHRTTKPTVASVDGVAVGAGMNMALGCDIVVATDRARFSEIFVKRGLTMDFGGTWLLPRLIGLARARELALTGRIVGAPEALEIGLVARVVPAADLEYAVNEVAMELADGAPLAQSFIKRALDRSSSMTFEQALAFEEQAQAVLLASEDLTEGAEAFIEKRQPRFKGR